jgi:hypothetical protein
MSEGPAARTETLDRLEFLARLVTRIPDSRQVRATMDGTPTVAAGEEEVRSPFSGN